jgi:hypothetical protein
MKQLFIILFSLSLLSCSKEVPSVQSDYLKFQTSVIPNTLDSGIIAKFLFRANLVDSTVYRNDGRWVNATFGADRFGRPNESFYSNNGYMEANNIPFNISQNYSISFWFKIMSFREGNALMELNRNRRYDGNPILWQHNNFLYLSRCNNSNERMSIGYIPSMKGKWVNVTWTVVNGLTNLYVNGNFIGSSRFFYHSYFGITLTVGNAGNIGSPLHQQPTDAYVDDIKIWGRVLTNAEITSLSLN